MISRFTQALQSRSVTLAVVHLLPTISKPEDEPLDAVRWARLVLSGWNKRPLRLFCSCFLLLLSAGVSFNG